VVVGLEKKEGPGSTVRLSTPSRSGSFTTEMASAVNFSLGPISSSTPFSPSSLQQSLFLHPVRTSSSNTSFLCELALPSLLHASSSPLALLVALSA